VRKQIIRTVYKHSSSTLTDNPATTRHASGRSGKARSPRGQDAYVRLAETQMAAGERARSENHGANEAPDRVTHEDEGGQEEGALPRADQVLWMQKYPADGGVKPPVRRSRRCRSA